MGWFSLKVWEVLCFANSIPALGGFLRALRFPPTPKNRNPFIFLVSHCVYKAYLAASDLITYVCTPPSPSSSSSSSSSYYYYHYHYYYIITNIIKSHPTLNYVTNIDIKSPRFLITSLTQTSLAPTRDNEWMPIFARLISMKSYYYVFISIMLSIYTHNLI